MDRLRMLDDVACWTLTADGWHRVDDALRQLEEALDRGDEDRINQCTTALILAGPRRTGRGVNDTMDRRSRQPAPTQTRDLVNRLVHRLGRDGTPDQSAPNRDDDETA